MATSLTVKILKTNTTQFKQITSTLFSISISDCQVLPFSNSDCFSIAIVLAHSFKSYYLDSLKKSKRGVGGARPTQIHGKLFG